MTYSRPPKRKSRSRSNSPQRSVRQNTTSPQESQVSPPPGLQRSRSQSQSKNSSTKRKSPFPEPSPPSPPPQILFPDKLNVVGEIHPISDARRDLEKQFCYAQTGSKVYLEEFEFKAKDYTPEYDHRGRELPDRRDRADPMKLRMIQDILFVLENLTNIKCAIEEQNFDIAPDLIGRDIGQHSEMLRDEYVETFTGIDGFEFKDSQTEEAMMELGSKIEAAHKSSTNISNILKSSELELEQLNTLFPAVEQAVTEAFEVKKLLCKDGPEVPDDEFDDSSDSKRLIVVKRSEDMNKAGNKRAPKTKGWVWTIGDDHREHMEPYKKDYNLVPQSKYNDAIEKFKVWREYQLKQQQLGKQRKERQFQEDFDNFIDPSAYE